MEAKAVLQRYKKHLLSIPQCTAVALGFKEVCGRLVPVRSIVVFVKKKLPEIKLKVKVPPFLEGIPTDVVEREFCFNPVNKVSFLKKPKLYRDMHTRYKTLFCGLALGCAEVSETYGTLCCFIHTTGKKEPNIPAGNYILSNMHVMRFANKAYNAEASDKILQPEWMTEISANYRDSDVCGTFIAGFWDAKNDCAIASIHKSRSFENKVPVDPNTAQFSKTLGFYSVKRRYKLSGVKVAKAAGEQKKKVLLAGDKVYKFGATTGYTRGRVIYDNYSVAKGHESQHGVDGALYIENDSKKPWAGPGDSGSAVMKVEDKKHYIVGLLFQEDTNCLVEDGQKEGACYAGLAYDIQSQMKNFCDIGGSVRLA